MKVAVTGASGLIGSALLPVLRESGHDVVRLVRRTTQAADEVRWDPAERRLDPAALADVDGVVHLAGAGVADARWTDKRKAAILDSRVDGTTTLATALAAADPRPRVLVSGSAVGWYGDGGDRVLTETAPAGQGFLADVVERWEAATAGASDAGVRVAHARTGLVLSAKGGLLGRLLPLFKVGLGGKVGPGTQYWPWISLADEVRALVFLLEGDLSGPVNLTGPEPVTNAVFTKAAGAVLHRPTLAPVPSFAIKLALGSQMAEEIALFGQRAIPQALTAAGFSFDHPTVESALQYVSGRA